jgi:hypothetical protein
MAGIIASNDNTGILLKALPENTRRTHRLAASPSTLPEAGFT